MERVILGIDPGTVMMGYGIVKQVGKSIRFVEMDVLNLSKEVDAAKKLHRIFECTVALIEKYQPACLAIEAPFFGKNVQSMLKLGRAQGVAIAAAMSCNIPVFEYAPRKIKMSITGKGASSKEQVAMMLFRLMNMDNVLPKHLDATDGLAAAVCHALQNDIAMHNMDTQSTVSLQAKQKSQPRKKYSGWETFVAQNEKRVS
ncbi:MAG: crossover junction endodeoxyribonuclease RuvC [Bacteroidales bacterium]|jgi:crossover junction endodeoxyribonuclease RuvC|nr:crossover junction endodeoxyribonuclease RuvC [Bacteroidales bacterium]